MNRDWDKAVQSQMALEIWQECLRVLKATNISKRVDKRLGVKGKVVGKKKNKLDSALLCHRFRYNNTFIRRSKRT